MVGSPWTEEGMKERCTRRAQELGKTLSQVLSEAGMGHDTLDRIPPQGRRTDTLNKLARKLDWSLAQVMGIATYVPLDGAILKQISELTHRVLSSYIKSRARNWSLPDEYYDEMAAILNLVMARQANGRTVDAGFLDGIEATLNTIPRQNLESKAKSE